MLILIYIYRGQPGRALEILSIRQKNIEQGRIRNIFIKNGLVIVVTGYHKGYRSSNNIKIIHRYLPQEIEELLVYYLWLVLPFYEKLQFQVKGEQCSSPFLQGDSRKIDHRQWTRPKHRWRDRSGNRHSIRLENNYDGSHSLESYSPESSHQSSHSPVSSPSPAIDLERSPTRGEHPIDVGQPIQEWTSEQLRKIMQKASVRLMGVKINISTWRQIAIAISYRYCRENPFQNEDPSQEGDILDEEGIDDDPWDLQTGHGTHIVGMIYTKELMEGYNIMIGRREKFRHVSQEWHKFLQFKSAQEISIDVGQKRKRQTLDDDI